MTNNENNNNIQLNAIFDPNVKVTNPAVNPAVIESVLNAIKAECFYYFEAAEQDEDNGIEVNNEAIQIREAVLTYINAINDEYGREMLDYLNYLVQTENL